RAGAGVEPRVEARRRRLRRKDRDVAGEGRVQRLGRPLRRGAALDLDGDDVREGVDSRVRAAGHCEPVDGAVELAERPPDLALDGPLARLPRPTTEGRAVILDDEPQPHL